MRIKDRGRRDARLMMQDRDILRARMEYLHAVLVGENGDERREIRDRERIDDGGNRSVIELQQAELRVIGLLAHELGVNGEHTRTLELASELLELRLRRDKSTQGKRHPPLPRPSWPSRARDAGPS